MAKPIPVFAAFMLNANKTLRMRRIRLITKIVFGKMYFFNEIFK